MKTIDPGTTVVPFARPARHFAAKPLFRTVLAALAIMLATLIANPARAVPSFAQQTGQPCQACHVGGIGPQLTEFGREFKLGGYTLRAQKSVPIAAMAIASVTHTGKDQVPPPSNTLSENNNLVLDQISVFIAGGIGKHLGGFAQITYDGVERHFAWDNLDVRAVTTGHVFGKDAVFGLDINNSPNVQDAWNTTAAWGFPYTDTAVSPTPGAAPLIDEGLAQTTIGVTAYAWIDQKFYLEGGFYTSPSAGTLHWLGSDPDAPGKIDGVAPYGRIAVQTDAGGGKLELGAFALKASIIPERDNSSGFTDHYTDVGFDAAWQRTFGSGDMLTANLRYVHETMDLQASCELGFVGAGGVTDCARTSLNEFRGDIAYFWRNKIGLTLGAFSISGPPNADLYGPTESPDSNGFIAQIDFTPWGDGSSPLGPLFNVRFGIQYTAYGKFDGAKYNYDGAGANASDNNALRFFTWIAF
jgi:hypothetical protein